MVSDTLCTGVTDSAKHNGPWGSEMWEKLDVLPELRNLLSITIPSSYAESKNLL